VRRRQQRGCGRTAGRLFPASVAGSFHQWFAPDFNAATSARSASISGGGTIVQANPAVYELTGVSSCATTASRAGTADEVKFTIIYGTTGVANNLAPTSVSSGSGDGVLTATTVTTYDAVGNLFTVQSPLGAAQTVRYRYDAGRQLVGVVGPDPDGAGPLLNPAIRITYNLDGQPTLVERGTVMSQSDPDWANFVSLEQQATSYDTVARKTQTSFASGGVTQSLVQYGYDNANRLTCTAVRMNTATFGSLPASACTLGTTGSNGPDLITANTYDAADQLTVVANGYGTPSQASYATATYSSNGYVLTVKDAENNLTANTYDGFDRVAKVNFPLPTQGSNASDPNDYEAYGYDANSNTVSRQLRSGQTISFTYDALNQATLKHFSAGPNQDVYYAYDLLGRALYAHYGSPSGAGVDGAYDALNRLTGATASGRTLSYQYDLAGNRTRVTWPDAAPNALYAAYVYDLLNRATAVEENGATSGAGLLASFAYDNLGRRTTLTRGNGLSTAYGGACPRADHRSDPGDGADRLSSLAQTFTNSGNNVTFGFTYTPPAKSSPAPRPTTPMRSIQAA